MKKLFFLGLITFAIVSCNESNNNSNNTQPVDTAKPAPIDTTVVTSINYYGLRTLSGTDNASTKSYTTVELSSGQCFCSSGGVKYVSTGRIFDITGLTQVDGTALTNCSDASPCK